MAEKKTAGRAAAASTEEAMKVIRSASEGLLYMSESDRPLEPFVWKKEEAPGQEEIDAALLLSVGKAAPGRTIKQVAVEKFFAPMTKEQDWHGEEEKKMADRFKELVKVLKSNLTNTVAFRIGDEGDEAIDAFVVGKTAEGDFAGVSTQLVET